MKTTSSSLSSLFTTETEKTISKSKGNGKSKSQLQSLFNRDEKREFVKPDVKVPDIAELKRLKEAKINPKKLNKKAKKRLASELKISDFGETSDQEEETDTEIVDEKTDISIKKGRTKRRKVVSGDQKEKENNSDSEESDGDNSENKEEKEMEEEEDSENELEETLKELREMSGKDIDDDAVSDSENTDDEREVLAEGSKILDAKSLGDTERDERTLFVGNLHISMKKQAVHTMFETFGEIESIRIRSVAVTPVKIDEKGNEKLLRKVAANKKLFNTEVKDTFNAYIVFKEKSSVDSALKLNNSIVCEKHIKVDRVGSTSTLQDPLRSIFIGNVFFNASEEDLRSVLIEALKENDDEDQDDSYFDTCIESIRIVRDSAQVGKGFAFALLKDKLLVSKLLRIQSPIKLNDRILRISACGKRTKGKRGETTMTRAEKRALKFGGSTPLPGAKGRIQKKIAKGGILLSDNTEATNKKSGLRKQGRTEIKKTDDKKKKGPAKLTNSKKKKQTSKSGEKGKLKQTKIGKKRTVDGKKIRVAGKRNDPNRKK